jgi:hypothetical protein
MEKEKAGSKVPSADPPRSTPYPPRVWQSRAAQLVSRLAACRSSQDGAGQGADCSDLATSWVSQGTTKLAANLATGLASQGTTGLAIGRGPSYRPR